MAKEELYNSRFIGWLAKQFGAFPVAKGKLDRRAGRRALELLTKGQVLVILPEGKRSENGKLGEAYPGAALLAVRSGVPIVPVGIIGTEQLTGKSWFLRRPRIELRIGQPFTTPTLYDKLSKKQISHQTDEIMIRIAGLLPLESRGRYGYKIGL